MKRSPESEKTRLDQEKLKKAREQQKAEQDAKRIKQENKENADKERLKIIQDKKDALTSVAKERAKENQTKVFANRSKNEVKEEARQAELMKKSEDSQFCDPTVKDEKADKNCVKELNNRLDEITELCKQLSDEQKTKVFEQIKDVLIDKKYLNLNASTINTLFNLTSGQTPRDSNIGLQSLVDKIKLNNASSPANNKVTIFQTESDYATIGSALQSIITEFNPSNESAKKDPEENPAPVVDDTKNVTVPSTMSASESIVKQYEQDEHEDEDEEDRDLDDKDVFDDILKVYVYLSNGKIFVKFELIEDTDDTQKDSFEPIDYPDNLKLFIIGLLNKDPIKSDLSTFLAQFNQLISDPKTDPKISSEKSAVVKIAFINDNDDDDDDDDYEIYVKIDTEDKPNDLTGTSFVAVTPTTDYAELDNALKNANIDQKFLTKFNELFINLRG